MERNTKTTVKELKPGDRFYKCNDKNKMVYEKIEHETKQTHYQTYRHWCIWAGYMDHPTLSEHAKEAAAIALKPETEVIFLRHKNQ